MAHTLSFSPLALELPSSRMSVDFTTFSISQPPVKTSALRINKPTPQLPRKTLPSHRPRPKPVQFSEVVEEPRSDPRAFEWQPSKPQQRFPPPRLDAVSSQPTRTNSSASSKSNVSSISSTSTAASVFSNVQSISTVRTSDSLRSTSRASSKSYTRDPITLTSLPISLLEQIISYALCLPLNVSIGPRNSGKKHMQYRYHRAGLDYIDIQLIRKHPVFMISHQLRNIALDVFHEKCDFVIDLQSVYHTKVSSTVSDNIKKHQSFWIDQQPPKMVRDTLRNLSKLYLRLPVPSCENSSHRGRAEEHWIDGSDGQGGGNWKIKSLKKEKEAAVDIEACLTEIMALVQAGPETTLSRGRSKSLSRSRSFRLRSKSRERADRGRAASLPEVGQSEDKRKPLKRMEVFLVKRNSHVMVLPETLSYVKLLRTVPVTGFTKYYFELEEQKVIWCTKYGKRWRGFEPSGDRLLEDLQGLSIASKPIEPLRTPTSYKFVNTKGGKLTILDAGLPKTPIVLERPLPDPKDAPPVPTTTNAQRSLMPWGWKKSHKRKDSFTQAMDDSMEDMGNSGTTRAPPSIDELKKIAEDIKNGLY